MELAQFKKKHRNQWGWAAHVAIGFGLSYAPAQFSI
jgi:hypothetical protein